MSWRLSISKVRRETGYPYYTTENCAVALPLKSCVGQVTNTIRCALVESHYCASRNFEPSYWMVVANVARHDRFLKRRSTFICVMMGAKGEQWHESKVESMGVGRDLIIESHPIPQYNVFCMCSPFL